MEHQREVAGPALVAALAATYVVIPAHNEAGVIEGVLDDLATLPCRVVVVDDGSSDGTFDVCSRRPVDVLRHAVNLGQGAALQTGISYATKQDEVRFVVTFDADGQHQVDAVVALIESLLDSGCDAALGTRFASPSGTVSMPPTRRALLKVAVAFTRVTTGLRVTDTHNGLRALTAQAAGRLHIRQPGMAHASEILSWIRSERLRWCEVPVSVHYSAYSLGKGQRGSAAVDIVWDLMTGRMR